MVLEVEKINLNNVNESINGLNDKLSGLQKNVIDDNLDKLEFKDKASGLLSKLNKIFDINLFGLGTVGALTGFKVFDVAKYKDKKGGGLLNFIFKKYGGVEGLHKSYIEETLKTVFSDQPEKEKAVRDIYASYISGKEQSLVNDPLTDQDSLNVNCGLGLDEKTPKTVLDKIPSIKFSYMRDAILQGIKGNEQYLDPNVLSGLGLTVPSKQGTNGTLLIDDTNADWDPNKIDKTIIEKYIASKTLELVSDEGFMTYIPSSEHMLLSSIGGLFINGNAFSEAMLIGVKKPEDFGGTTPETKPVDVKRTEIPQTIDLQEAKITEELTKVKSPVTAKMVLDSAKKYGVPVTYIMAFMKNDSSYGTAGLAVKTHNPGNVGNTDDGSKKDRGTREAGVDAVADNLKDRIDVYQTKYGKAAMPTVEELASGLKADTKEKFFGVYMTAPKGPEIVQNIQEDLSQAA